MLTGIVATELDAALKGWRRRAEAEPSEPEAQEKLLMPAELVAW